MINEVSRMQQGRGPEPPVAAPPALLSFYYYYTKKIIHAQRAGFIHASLAKAKDSQGFEHLYLLYLWKREGDKIVGEMIGMYNDEMAQLLDKLGIVLENWPEVSEVTPPTEKPVSTRPVAPVAPPVAPTEKVTVFPPAAEEKKWKQLRNELAKYKADGWSFRLRELHGGFRLSVRKGREKERYIGSYKGKLKEICEELGIKFVEGEEAPQGGSQGTS